MSADDRSAESRSADRAPGGFTRRQVAALVIAAFFTGCLSDVFRRLLVEDFRTWSPRIMAVAAVAVALAVVSDRRRRRRPPPP